MAKVELEYWGEPQEYFLPLPQDGETVTSSVEIDRTLESVPRDLDAHKAMLESQQALEDIH